jgi:hypothetical protein
MRVAFLIATISAILFGQTADRPAVYTAAQAEAGQREIQNNKFGNCTLCHTTALTGRMGNGDAGELPPVSSLPEDYQKTIINYGGRVPALVGPTFISRWSRRTTRDLSREFQERFASPLTEETRLNIISYLMQLNGASPGTQPLTNSTDEVIGRLFPAHEE